MRAAWCLLRSTGGRAKMNKCKNYLSTAVSFVVLVSALVLMNPSTSHSQTSNKDVRVVNTTAEPVPVRDVDNARQPFQEVALVVIPASSSSASSTFTVPAGKRLVIEYVSGNNTLFAGQKLRGAFILTYVGGQYQRHYLLIHHGEPYNNTNEEFVTAQEMKAYADPGTQVEVFLYREFA